MNEERDLLAAEYALGLVEGAELVDARRLAASDDEFARAVAAWEERLAPLVEEVRSVEPGDRVWEAIQRAIAAAPAAGTNVVDLRKRLRVWRGAAVGMTAIAASLALVVGYQSTREDPKIVQPAARAPVLIASLASGDEEAALSVAYDAEQANLLVTPARLTGAPGHDHELWIIPEGGAPVSLGIVRPGPAQRVPVPPQVAPHFQANASIALSREPAGGSPTGQPTGPVVAAGELTTV